MGRVLKAFQNAVAGEITRMEGNVAKYMGDGVLAYFGWPRAHGFHCRARPCTSQKCMYIPMYVTI
jgi:class 3 adenylate cyclase